MGTWEYNFGIMAILKSCRQFTAVISFERKTMEMSSTDDLLSQQFNARNGYRLLKTRKTLRHRTIKRKNGKNGKVTVSLEEIVNKKEILLIETTPSFPLVLQRRTYREMKKYYENANRHSPYSRTLDTLRTWTVQARMTYVRHFVFMKIRPTPNKQE